MLQDQNTATDQRRDEHLRAAQHRLTRKDIPIIEIAAAAYALIMDEIERGIPEISRRSYESALRDAVIVIRAAAKVKDVAAVTVDMANEAGDLDLLDHLIHAVVRARPDISLLELRLFLRACQYHGGVIAVSITEIVFAVPRSREKHLPARTVAYPLMDLKIRLGRARKAAGILRARQSRASTSQMKAT